MNRHLLLIFLVVFSFEVSGQTGKWETEGGFSFPDLIHVGIKRKISEVNKIGFSAGSFPQIAAMETFPFALTLSHELTIDYAMKDPSRPTYYTAQKLTYVSHTAEEITNNGLFLSILLGRHFRINATMGINADIGLSFLVDEKFKSKTVDVSHYRNYEMQPAFGLNWYWKLPASYSEK